MLSSEDNKVSISDTDFVQNTLRDVYTVERFGSVKAAQIAAYDFLRKRVRGRTLTLRRVRTFFEGKAKAVRGEEKDAVRAAQIEEARNERNALRARLDRLDGLLAEMDAELFSPALAAVSEQSRDAR